MEQRIHELAGAVHNPSIKHLVLVGVLLALLAGSLRAGPATPRADEDAALRAACHPLLSLLVPAYFYPDEKGLPWWNALLAASTRVPVVAIVNPADGPGEQADVNYLCVLQRARPTPLVLIGYVHSAYARRPLPRLQQEIDRWTSFYPQIQGIFIDEQASGGEAVGYYAELYRYIRKTKGLKWVVANPGVVCAEGYFAAPTADVIGLHEDAQPLPASAFPDWMANYSVPRRLILGYGVPTAGAMVQWLETAAQGGGGFVYVTNDAGANPWDSLPAYWDQEVQAVRRINARALPGTPERKRLK